MNVSTLPAVPKARHRRKRVGRGIGSGHGKTSTRGQKGQRARSGSGKRPGFEGGRTPLIRRIPKRGFRQKATGHEIPREIVNIKDLNRAQEGQRLTPEVLQAMGLIQKAHHRIKLLGDGKLDKKVIVVVHEASSSAQAKMTQAGGQIEFLG